MKKLIGIVVLFLALSLIYSSVVLSLKTDTTYELNEALILFSLTLNVFIMVGAASLFIWFYYDKSVLKRLYLKASGTMTSIAFGAIIAVIFLFIISGALVVSKYKDTSPLAEQIGVNLTVLSLIFIPILSAISEEVFFRGLIHMQLEERIGFFPSVIISSAMFSIAHLEYETVLQVVIPFAFGLILGFLIHKRKNTWAPISAHFTYNFIALLAVYVSG